MKIALASALYPPDIAQPAPYVKELARHLIAAGHEVTAVVYGAHPEPVPHVRIIAIDKRRPLFARLWAYARALHTAAGEADIVFAENGPSVELALLFLARPYILHRGDKAAHGRARGMAKLLERLAERRAVRVIDELPRERPEVLPLGPRPEAALAAYQHSWEEHLRFLQGVLHA